MSENRRTYSREFKQEAVARALQSGKAHSELERELGISAGLLKQWRRTCEARCSQ